MSDFNLFKITGASKEFLLKMRMEGRLVYLPEAPETRYCHTYRKQRKVGTNIISAMNMGKLYCNYGTHRPCDGGKI